MSVAARRCLTALSASGVDVAWQPMINVENVGRVPAAESAGAPASLRALRRPASADDTLVLHTVPGRWADTIEQIPASRVIGHVAWELDDVPLWWRLDMADVDEFWVPTEWNRDAFERAFRRPVHVVPHALDTARPTPPPLDLPQGVAVVALVSAWDWRKRPDRAIEAFCRAFDADDDVMLVVKTGNDSASWPGRPRSVPAFVRSLVARFDNAPKVVVDDREWSDAQVRGLLAASACTLSLSASEGWGLGAFDGAALGVPALITGYGGQVEYLGSDYPGLIPYRMIPTHHLDRRLFEPGTEWAHADMDAAIEMLRSVIDGSAHELIARAATLAPELRHSHSPEAVSAIVQRACPAASMRSVRSSSSAPVEQPPPKVAVLTPLKDSAHRATDYVDRILTLEHPPDRLSVSVLVSDSVDGTAAAFRSEFDRLRGVGIEATVWERDFGYRMPSDVPRWEPGHQLARRTVLAKSRNHLLMRGLGDADWALWIDGDVVEFPPDVIEQLLAVGEDVVHPNCLDGAGRVFDLNAWTDNGKYHFGDYDGEGLVELHSVGGTMLLVNADRHRDGLIWPAHLHGVANDRVRTDPAVVGRPELGEIEAEGLAILANDMGIACWGLPGLVIRHE